MDIFKTQKLIIGMIHLAALDGKSFKGIDYVFQRAKQDLKALEQGGVNGAIIENWEDESKESFIGAKQKKHFEIIAKKLANISSIPLGINVLPNDYKTALLIASDLDLSFIQLDVFVDHVKTDYTYSSVDSFEINVDLEVFKNYRKKMCAENILIFVSIHPKHYILLEQKTIEQSAIKAMQHGADVLVITGEVTGNAPIIEQVKAVKKIANIPVFIGSGLNENNLEKLLTIADGAIVGTSFKTKDFSKVDEKKVKQIMSGIKLRF